MARPPRQVITTRTAPRWAKTRSPAPVRRSAGHTNLSTFPRSAYEAWDARALGARRESEWNALFARYTAAFPSLATELTRRLAGRLPADFSMSPRDAPPSHLDATSLPHGPMPTWASSSERLAPSPAKAPRDAGSSASANDSVPVATRKASQQALTHFAKLLPELLGGSADLTHSNLVAHPGSQAITRDPAGNHIHFGVREFGMTAIANGIALHGGFIPYVATFLTFSDYARNAIRMSALMRQRVIHIYTHDSIGLGEDGPTHQPIEHAESLRLIPNLDVWRPADSTETFIAWEEAIKRNTGPSALLLSRQALPPHPRTHEQLEAIRSGAYTLRADGLTHPQAIIVATGSEVQLATSAADALTREGFDIRVVSMPCVEAFERQPREYRDSVLPRGVPVITVEAGATKGWWKYAGHTGAVIGIDRFGESAPDRDLWTYFELTPERVASTVRQVLGAGPVEARHTSR